MAILALIAGAVALVSYSLVTSDEDKEDEVEGKEPLDSVGVAATHTASPALAPLMPDASAAATVTQDGQAMHSEPGSKADIERAEQVAV